jgi:hypothetical protein
VFDFLLEDPNRKHAILQAPSFFGAIRSAKEWKSKLIASGFFGFKLKLLHRVMRRLFDEQLRSA